MKSFPFIALLIIVALVLISCGTTQNVRLEQIKTIRDYHGSKEDIMNTVRFFIATEELSLIRFEAEYGQIQAGRRFDEKMMMMKMQVYAADSARTTVDVKFFFRNFETNPTPSEEEILVEYYTRLFDMLDDQFPAPK